MYTLETWDLSKLSGYASRCVTLGKDKATDGRDLYIPCRINGLDTCLVICTVEANVLKPCFFAAGGQSKSRILSITV